MRHRIFVLLLALLAVVPTSCRRPPPEPPVEENHAPVITSSPAQVVLENTAGTMYTITATDEDGDSVGFGLGESPDKALFTSDMFGNVRFRSPPDFENPADADGDNVYELVVRAFDATSSSSLSVMVTVVDVDEPVDPEPPVDGNELFVSTTGNDSGDGSFDSPYLTIQHALDEATAGDTVTVRGPAGNRLYEECDVRLRKKLTLRAYSGEQPHINCDMGVSDSVVIQIDPAASGSRVSGFELSGGMYYGIQLQTWWYQGADPSDPSTAPTTDVILEDLVIHDTGRDGIKITPKCDDVIIRRVEIYNTGAIYPPGTSLDDRNADGIDNVNGSRMVVEDSYIHDISTTGLYFKGGAEDVLIQRNRIENTGMSGILIGFDTSVDYFDLESNPGYYEAIRGTVINNYIKNTTYAGIGLYASKDSIVANNTIVDAANEGHAALYFGVTFQDWDSNAARPPNESPSLRNNLVIDSTSCVDIRYSQELGGLSGLSGWADMDTNGFVPECRFSDNRPGSILEDGTLSQWVGHTGGDGNSLSALFTVDATGHIPANSPAIDEGSVIPSVTDDIDQQPRISYYDIGADEI